MNKKQTVKKLVATTLGLGLALTGTACGFVTTDNDKDMKQTIAEVNIVKYLEKDETFKNYAGQVSKIIKEGEMETSIYKSDLISAFLNVGYSYMQNYGSTAKETFEMLMDSLVSRKIIVQYAMAEYLKYDDSKPEENLAGEKLTADECIAYIDLEYTNAAEDVKPLLKAHPEVSVLKYFLTENGSDTEAYAEVVYTLNKSVNDALDSTETTIIDAEEESHDHGEVRTTPTGVNKQKTDYIVKHENIYTGRNAADSCGEYETVNGSTTVTRQKAYSQFLANLQSNNLIKADEDTTDFTKMDYYYVELVGQLEQSIITKYTEDLDEKLTAKLTEDYVEGKYTEMLEKQTEEYGKDHATFETALDGLSDTAFALYSPKADYGFVYNILLPFSAMQNQSYNSEKNRNLEKPDLYEYRAKLLSEIEGKDLRDSWFNEHEDENYAYSVGEGTGKKWYFFDKQTGENKNLDRYEALTHYAGNYPYNGTVTQDETTKKYTCTPNKMDIDEFIELMETYLAAETGVTVAGNERTKEFVEATYGADTPYYVTDGDDYKLNDSDEFTDYLQFMYYEGKVNFSEGFNAANYFKAGTQATKAVSAFNELMFAYSTDTGCLNKYMGYLVSPYKTSFVGEFEAAAQYAIRELGVGGYVVCPSDYGWHIIYVSNVFEKGNVYGDVGYNHAEKETEGTFSYFFYESLKANVATDTSIVQDNILTDYKNDTCVKYYKDRYEDLLELQL